MVDAGDETKMEMEAERWDAGAGTTTLVWL